MLDRRGIEFVGQGLQHGFARGAVVAEDADLDQAVRLERGLDLFLDGRAQSITPHEDDGVEMMGIGAMDFALGGSECDLRHGTIIVYTEPESPIWA